MQRRTVLGWGLASALGAGAAAAPAGLRPVVVTAQATGHLKLLPLVLAARLGYFADEGLAVTLQDVAASRHTLPELADWPAQVFAGTFERTLYLNAQGRMHQAFALLSRSPQVVLAVSARHQQPETGVSDLVGARVGVAASGSLGHRIAQLVLMRAGLRPHDVHFIEFAQAQDAQDALERGEVEALSYTDPLITRLEQRGTIRVVSDTRTLRDSDLVFGGPVACTCLSAPLHWVEREPELVQGLTNAVVRALKWLHTAAPIDLLHHLPEGWMDGDRGLFLAAFARSRETLAVDGLFAEQAPRNVLRALDRLRLPVALGQQNLDLAWTNRYAQRAKVQFRV